MPDTKTLRIVVLPGDGVGPEVVGHCQPIFDAAEKYCGVKFEREIIPCGGRYFLEHGQEWPDGSHDRVRDADAVLLGAVGHAGSDGQPVRRDDGEMAGYEMVVGLRLKLDLYANIRPVKLFPGVLHCVHGAFKPVWDSDKVNMLIIRENTEDAYVPGAFHLARGGQRELVVSPTVITRKGTERVVRAAFEAATLRNGAPGDGVQRVTCVDKSNVVRAHAFFREVFDEVASAYPGISRDYAYTDAFCQWLPREPERYDVVVAPNFSGDVITDLAAVLQGGMGLAASGNIGDRNAMFEPIHGSAPPLAGKDQANPVATLLALRMMFDWLGKEKDLVRLCEAGDRLERAIEVTLAKPEGRTADVGGTASCSGVGALVLDTFEQELGG